MTFLKKDKHHYKAYNIIIWKSLEKIFGQVNILLFFKVHKLYLKNMLQTCGKQVYTTGIYIKEVGMIY